MAIIQEKSSGVNVKIRFFCIVHITIYIVREFSTFVINSFQMMMKLAGLEEKYIWIGWYIHTLIHGVIIYTFISFLVGYDFRGPDYAVLRYIQPSLLWAIIMLYFTAQLAFCFVFCTIFHSSKLHKSMQLLTNI